MILMTLSFVTENNRFPLIQTHFQHPLLSSPAMTYRGQRALDCAGTFRWSTGVMGLCLLLVRHGLSLMMENAADHPPVMARIEGEHGSLASSLDYALSKRPMWLMDMFGITAKGTPLSQLLLHRINPERKRPGPVVVFVRNTSFKIDVYVDGRSANAPADLENLLNAMENTRSSATPFREHTSSVAWAIEE